MTVLLDRAYAGVVRFADWVVARRGLMGWVALPSAVLAMIAINRFILLDFPNSGDENAYLYQAATFAAGRLWNQAPAAPEFFTLNYIVFDGERAFSSFPVGWPLALGGAMALGVPVWLVNPVLGAVTMALTARLGTLLYSRRVGVIAAAIVAVSPFFLFNGASYFSHMFCGGLLLGAACLAARDNRTPVWVPIGIGLLVGWAILARYLTGVVLAIPIILFLIRPQTGVTGASRVRWIARALALVAAGGLPWVVLLAWYNHTMTGNPWQLTTLPLTRALWFRPGWYYRGADFLSTHLQRYLTWTPPLRVALYVYYLRRAPHHLRRGWLDWLPMCMVAALYAYVERGGNQYGPRFHAVVYPFMALFVVGQVFTPEKNGAPPRPQRVAFGLLAASVAVLPALFTVHAVVERQVIRERRDPYEKAKEAELQNALVLMAGRVGTTRSIAVEDLTRNGLDYSGPVLFALDQSPEANCLAAKRLGRTPYLYEWNWERATSVLRPIACGPAPGAGRTPRP